MRRVAVRKLGARRMWMLSLGLTIGCGVAEPDELETIETTALRQDSTLDLAYYYQPFKQNSVWNLKLSPTRSEVNFPAAAWTHGLLAPSDADYGVNVYFAKTTDPIWHIRFNDYNTVLDVFDTASPVGIRAPLGMLAPSGSDGSIIIVDPALKYGYELWSYSPTGATTAKAESINVVDLQSMGIHRNVGITGSGLPGIGGLLKAWELKNDVAIRHKLWVAVHPTLLYAKAIAPAVTHDLASNGSAAFLKYGDVIALGKRYSFDTNPCKLSPFMKRIARALQDYGGIVQDQGGDAVGLVAEVDAVKNAIDIDYETTMWTQFACLQKYLVKVKTPWTDATPGGLGLP